MSEVDRVFVNWSGIDDLWFYFSETRFMSNDPPFAKDKSRWSILFVHQGDYLVIRMWSVGDCDVMCLYICLFQCEYKTRWSSSSEWWLQCDMCCVCFMECLVNKVIENWSEWWLKSDVLCVCVWLNVLWTRWSEPRVNGD